MENDGKISASYNVDIAKKIGLTCAVLLNKLNYLSRYTSREDGYCWRTSEELENELGISPKQQKLAITKLEKLGLIKTKNTYITGTQVKCKHFLVIIGTLKNDEKDKSDYDERYKSDYDERYKSDYDERYKSYNNIHMYNINNNNTLEDIHNIKNIKKDELFTKFWNEYPKKVGKESALKNFNKLNVDDELLDVIVNKLKLQMKQKQWQNKQYIPNPSTYLNQHRWEDEIIEDAEDKRRRELKEYIDKKAKGEI